MADNDNSTNSNEKLPHEKRDSADKYNPGNQAGKGPVHKEDAEQRERWETSMIASPLNARSLSLERA